MIGQRHQDIKNGMTVPPEWSLSKLVDFATKPAWVSGVLRGKRRTFGNLAGHLKISDDITSLSTWINSQFDTTLNWKDVEWIRSIWPGKLVLKGILDVEDAEIAAKSGAQALVVSNHGGRQLDGAPSSIEVLPEIVDTVGSQIEVMFDGGIRSGQDVMRALALGAKSCMIGRAYAYGLGAGGQAGVAKAISLIAKELETTMGLCGVNTIAEIDDRVSRCEATDKRRVSSRPSEARAETYTTGARAGHAVAPACSTTNIGGYPRLRGDDSGVRCRCADAHRVRAFARPGMTLMSASRG